MSKNTKPTDEQIQEQIKKLLEIKPKVLRRSVFGDDHRAAIDAQVEVLRTKMLAIPDGYFDEDCANILDAAIEACAWLDGEEMQDPGFTDLVDTWKEMVRE